MKKNYFIAILALIVNFVSAQIEPTAYRGAFAPAPTAMWTDSWTNWDPKNETYPDAATVVNVTTDITANTTWTTGKTYKITGLIYVRNNATLTIQPGVVVKGVFSNTGTALVVTKGAKLNAIGTAASPIVFTSNKTVAQGRNAGDWGGIILLGKAGFNLNNGVNNIEGITASVNTEYGGGTTPDDNDNSGTLKYVRIEFGGFVFSPNNEINGLTFGSVGKGTTIDNVQVSYSGDDSFEWFGGSVNCKHLVAYRGLDDDFDTDNGYKGIVQYALGVKDPQVADNPAISTSEGFESDNNAGGTVATTGFDNTSAIFTNITMVGPAVRATLSPALTVASGHARALRLRRTTQLKVYNSIFMDFKNSYLFVDGATTVANANNGLLKFKNNIIAGISSSDLASFPGGVNPTSLNSWFTSNNNSLINASTGLLTTPYGATSSTYTGLDYRPGATASTGADFSDASLTPYISTATGTTPLVNNVVYCKGDVATQLTAVLTTTGVSLKWYTSTNGTTFTLLTSAPTPLTSTVGSKTYYVSQVDASNIESTKVPLVVTVNALPTEVISTIVGAGPAGSTSATAVGKYIGTTEQFTYTVNAFVDASLTYLWTVPLGVNIVAGQGTNTVTVNYANVAAGAGSVGSIQLQAVNANGCRTLAKTLAITKALPAAPTTLKLTEGASVTALTSYAKFMGQSTALTLTAATVADAASYQWELPAGVALANGGVAGTSFVRWFTAEPFNSPLTTQPAPSVGTKYWKVTYAPKTYDVNGVSTVVTTSTCEQFIQGGSTYGATTTQPYAPYGTVISSDKPAILISFAGVTNASTTRLYLGVKAKNGVGSSASSNNNATNAADIAANIPGINYITYTEVYTAPIPTTTNATSVITATGTTPTTAKLLKLTAAIPVAPATVVLTNPASATPTTAVINISTFIGTNTPFTLTAAASVAASSYEWELPAGVNVVAGSDLTSRQIQVNFQNVAPGTLTVYLGAKAKNGIGSSVTNNTTMVAPTTTYASLVVPVSNSTAKLLKVTAVLPTVVAAVSGRVAALCGGTAYEYTITRPNNATSFNITAPVGSVVTSASTSNSDETLSTTDLTFSVTYPAGFLVNTSTAVADKSLVITSVNGVGNSATSKSLTLATALANVGVNTNSYVNPNTGTPSATAFGKCIPQTFTIPAVPFATEYVWTLPNGATFESAVNNGTSVDINFGGVPTPTLITKVIVKVKAYNGCTFSTEKLITLTYDNLTCVDSKDVVAINPSTTSASELYPNPATDYFNIDLTASVSGNTTMEIYSINGALVRSANYRLVEGNNPISENISSLTTGIYIVKFINNDSNEVITKKLVKN